MIIQGVLHVHSRYSYDGKLTLTELRELLVAQGISFCCVTEHTDQLTQQKAALLVQECKALTTGSFIFIPGFEVSYTSPVIKDAHILMFGSSVFLGQKADPQMLRQWSKHAECTVLAHPVRNHFVLDEAMEEVIDGIEVWNAQYDGKLVPRTHAVALYEAYLQKKPDLLATGGLDFHRREHFGAPMVTLEVENLTEREIVKAITEGAYTFGTRSRTVSARGLWTGKDGMVDRALSFFSITVIYIGKLTNKILARFGIRLPKKIAQVIRRNI